MKGNFQARFTWSSGGRGDSPTDCRKLSDLMGESRTMSRTKPHKMSQYPLLSIEQHNAIDLLILGDTDHAVAEQIGVARETICRWRNENPTSWPNSTDGAKDVWQTAQERLRGLVGGHRHLRTSAAAR